MLTVNLSVPKVTFDKNVEASIVKRDGCTVEDARKFMLETNTGVQRVKGGTVCVYGLNTRFPVSLYPNQWRELAKYVPAVLAYIDAQEAAGNIVEREESSPTGRVALAEVNPIVAALMAAKNIDAKEAERIAKQSGLLK